MKAEWFMIGGAALFVISWAVHDVFKLFTAGLGATIISFVIFLSPVLVLIGIVIYILSRMRKKRTPDE